MSHYRLVRGPAVLKLERGLFELNGGIFQAPAEFDISRGKTVVIRTSSLESLFSCEPPSRMMVLSPDTSPFPSEWQEFSEDVAPQRPSRLFVVGKADSGKSFFCLYLANRLLQTYSRIAIIDCDLGQSDIGPPGCLGSAILTEPATTLQELEHHQLYFIGAVSPEGQLTSMLMGLERLLHGLEGMAELVIINTCGYIIGDAARVLKLSKLSIFRPDFLILLGEHGIFRWLTTPFPAIHSRYLPSSGYAQKTGQTMRKEIRNTLNRRYFNESVRQSLDFDSFTTWGCYFRTGVPLPPDPSIFLYGEAFNEGEGSLLIVPSNNKGHPLSDDDPSFPGCRVRKHGDESGLLIGLLDQQHYTLGLGIIELIDYEKESISFFTPLKDIRHVSILSFGTVKYNGHGEEAGFIHPGSF